MIDKVLAEYKFYAEEHGKGTLEGDYKKANKNHDKIIKTLERLRQFGKEGNDALLSLIHDQNQSVRCWAATHCLAFNEKEARNALGQLAREDGIIAFNAKMVLEEWKKGNLQIP
ncbi:MAG: DUF2019 domain-containing protein [Planctomycetaceae bacterium]|nr:DUF2019 domain-containing protein [Planctomycetaceae bacterium]